MPSKHAPIGPSSAHRWLECPGSVEANIDKPWEQSVYAQEGSSAHALLELCLRLDDSPFNYVGKRMEADLLPTTEAMAEAVEYAMDYVNGYMANNPKTKLRIEQPVYPAALLGQPDDIIWGTPDIQLDNYPAELVTVDYKHGVGIAVSVKDNPQIKLYHAGMRAERGKYRRYRSVVIQPRLARRRPVQEATLLDADLVKWLDKEVRPTIKIALAGNAPRRAGDWCRYCAANGKCPAQLKQTLERAKKEFGKDPKALPPSEIARFLQMVPSVKVAIEALEEYATRALHADVDIPGYEAGWGRTRRVWVDEEQANAALKRLGLATADRYSVDLLSPAKAEDMLRARGKWPKAVRGQPKPADPLEALVARTEAAPSYRQKRDN